MTIFRTHVRVDRSVFASATRAEKTEIENSWQFIGLLRSGELNSRIASHEPTDHLEPLVNAVIDAGLTLAPDKQTKFVKISGALIMRLDMDAVFGMMVMGGGFQMIRASDESYEGDGHRGFVAFRDREFLPWLKRVALAPKVDLVREGQYLHFTFP